MRTSRHILTVFGQTNFERRKKNQLSMWVYLWVFYKYQKYLRLERVYIFVIWKQLKDYNSVVFTMSHRVYLYSFSGKRNLQDHVYTRLLL